jgi:hypothetical protein
MLAIALALEGIDRRTAARSCGIDGATPDPDGLLAEAARHVARYKLPKAFVFVPHIVRSPAGKASFPASWLYRSSRIDRDRAKSMPAAIVLKMSS